MNIRDVAIVAVGTAGVFFLASGLLMVPMSVATLLRYDAYVEPNVLLLTETESDLLEEYRSLRTAAVISSASISLFCLAIGAALVFFRRWIAARWVAPIDCSPKHSATAMDFARVAVGTVGLAFVVFNLVDILAKWLTNKIVAWDDLSELGIWTNVLQLFVGTVLLLRPEIVTWIWKRYGKHETAA